MSATNRPLRLRWVVELADPGLAAAVGRLADQLVESGVAAAAGAGDADAVVVWADRRLPETDREALSADAEVLVLAGPTLHAGDECDWQARTGLAPTGSTPVHDVRVRAGRDAGTLGDRLADHDHGSGSHLGEHAHVTDRVLLVDKAEHDVEWLLQASVGLVDHPVAALRRGPGARRTLAWALGGTAAAVSSGARLFALALRRAVGDDGHQSARQDVRVGLLGYGAIGPEHAGAAAAVTGLRLTAICDRNGARLDAAGYQHPDARRWADPEALLGDDDVDVVVVSTPPDTHATWALRAVREGKHVVVEKPFALRTAEADAVLAEAARADRLAVVYQNRRFDPDYVTVADVVRSGRIGEVFHLETFVGGYGHPCNLWHSDAGVSGGAFYDWGAHVVDQILDLVPAAVETVTAAEHKRRWFDVTNADQSRVTMTFADGREAEFVHSDLAAALKPRWYVLGTEGAVVGHWRRERVVARSAVGTLEEDLLAPADSPPDLELHGSDGSVARLALHRPAPHMFHRELADALLLGLPMSVTGESSRRVLAVLEAAAVSAADRGRAVSPA